MSISLPPEVSSVLQIGNDSVFGFVLPTLPDFLADHTLLSEEFGQRIVEFSRRWVVSVASLWNEAGDASYSLRFDFDPGNGEGANSPAATTCLFLVRVFGGPSDKVERTKRHVYNVLYMLNFRPVDIPAYADKDGERCLNDLYHTEYSHAFEVAAYEGTQTARYPKNLDMEIPKPCVLAETPDPSLLNREWINATLYSFRSFWGAGGTMLLPFHALASQRAPTTLTICLRPTALTPWEQKNLAQYASTLESIAQTQTKAEQGAGVVRSTGQSATDPQLRHLARTAAAHVRRLSNPFLISVGCASDDHGAAWQVASALAAIIREETPYDLPDGETTPIVSNCRVLTVIDNRSYAASHYQLNFDSVSPYKATPSPFDGELRRIRHLVDARGATSFFRFPISVRGGLPGIEFRQSPPDFHPGPRTNDIRQDEINIGRYHVGGLANIPIHALTKHALITGFTGSGKTNTVLYLLHQLWEKRIPFLAIESAKQEYRALATIPRFRKPDGSPEISVYTLGNSKLRPIYLNPFELIEGVRLETHIGRLQTAFEAALPPIGPLPSLIAEALVLVYTMRGWDLDAVGPADSEVRDPDAPSFPTLRDMEAVLEGLIGPKSDRFPTARNYQGEILHNVMGFVMGRLRPLLIGSKEIMFSRRRSYPRPARLFGEPTILELNDLNHGDKALMVMFIITLLREYRETAASSSRLQHVTIVEEAHNVLSNPKASGADGPDTQAKAVEAFCNMLAEIRSLGEGLFIADQSPEKLATDAMRNTNLQIAHQLRDSADREAIARAMIMTDEQRDFLGKIRPGMAAVFFTGLERATFVEIPEYMPRPAEEAIVHKQFNKEVTQSRVEHPTISWAAHYSKAIERTVERGECKEIMDRYAGFGAGWWWLLGSATGEAFLQKQPKMSHTPGFESCWNCAGQCGAPKHFAKPPASVESRFREGESTYKKGAALFRRLEADRKQPGGASAELRSQAETAIADAYGCFVDAACTWAKEAGLAGDYDAAWCAFGRMAGLLAPDLKILLSTQEQFRRRWRISVPGSAVCLQLRTDFTKALRDEDDDRLVGTAIAWIKLCEEAVSFQSVLRRIRYRTGLAVSTRSVDEAAIRSAFDSFAGSP